MPSQAQYIEIPILPHVKNLLISIYGNEPIKANANNLPGKELGEFVFVSDEYAEKINGEKIKLHISHRIAPYYRKFINAYSLGCYFEKFFNMFLYVHVEAQRECGIHTMEAIKAFFEKYNIDEKYYTQHAASETYRRMVQRTMNN